MATARVVPLLPNNGVSAEAPLTAELGGGLVTIGLEQETKDLLENFVPVAEGVNEVAALVQDNADEVAANTIIVSDKLEAVELAAGSASVSYDDLGTFGTPNTLANDLNHAAGTTGQVLLGASAGLYQKQGAYGTGSWLKKSDATIPGLASIVDLTKLDATPATWGVADELGRSWLFTEDETTDFRIRNPWLDASTAALESASGLALASTSTALWGVADDFGRSFIFVESADNEFRLRNPWLDAKAAQWDAAGAAAVASRVAIDGDSRVDQCTDSNRTNTVGWLYWLQLLTGARFDFKASDNFGVGGETSAQVLARVASTAASTAGIVIALMSTNDRSTAQTAAASIANLAAYQAAILAAGKRLIWIAETPRADTAVTTFALAGAQIAYQIEVREWLLAQRSVPGVAVADPWPAMADPASLAVYAKTGYLKDGIHESTLGAYAIAQAVALVINTWLPPTARLPVSNSDVYSTSNNPKGCLTPNPMTLGAGGSISGAGGSGSVATGWTATVTSGVTAVMSKVTVGGSEWQQAVISGTPSGNTALTFSATIPSADLAPGDVLDAVAEIQVDSGHSGLRGVPIRVQITDSGSGALGMAGVVTVVVGDINLDAPPGAWGGIAPVPPVTVGVGTISAATLDVLVTGLSGSPISATIRWRAAAVRKSF